MEISVFQEPVDGMLQVGVRFYDYSEELGKSIEVEVWVPDMDSRAELAKQARLAALQLLKQAIADLELEISQSA